MDNISKCIRSRRSIFPRAYVDRPIDRAIIEEVLENANWAPNHKKTEPWRFKVFHGKASLEKLGAEMGAVYKRHTPEDAFKETVFNKFSKNPTRANCVVAICMQRDPAESLPEWEEVAAVACAVQNMWLTCTAHDIGSYWSSPGKIIKNAHEFLPLNDGERCLGLFYMGYHEMPEVERERGPVEAKTTWCQVS